MYIEDCLRGTELLMWSDVQDPLNVGSEELVSVDELVDLVEDIAGVKLKRRYRLDAPQGVRGRNSDNTLIRERLGWEPSITLREGLEETYRWIYDQMATSRTEAALAT
jgi:nucleoside-diphosphate-sugar epimerase